MSGLTCVLLYFLVGVIAHLAVCFWASKNGKENSADVSLVFGFDIYLLIIWPLSLPFIIRDAKRERAKSSKNEVPSQQRKELEGLKATVVRDLKPSGEVMIDDKKYEATLDYGVAQCGEAVEVVEADNFRLKVKKLRRR